MSAPSVYAAINAITAELAGKGIAKTHTNEVDDYKYRSIDDLLNRLAPLLAEHRLCILPSVSERSVTEREEEQDGLVLHVAVRTSFALISVDDGSSHDVASYGEALDSGDKATAKAMSAAYKSAMFQTFCIPVPEAEDADRSSHRLSRRRHNPEPIQGWAQWCLDIEDIVGLCETEQAMSIVQERNRDWFTALSREQPELYKSLGNAFASRRDVLLKRATGSKVGSGPTKRHRRRKTTGDLQNA